MTDPNDLGAVVNGALVPNAGNPAGNNAPLDANDLGAIKDGSLVQSQQPRGPFQPQSAAPVEPEIARSVLGAVQAAWESSSTGLWARGKLPSIVEPDHAGGFQDLAYMGTTMLAELPAATIGYIVGTAAGSEIPVVGNAIGGFAGAGALPFALRRALMDAYQTSNGPRSWGDIMRMTGDVLLSGSKGAAVGTALAMSGGALTPEYVGGALGVKGLTAASASGIARVASAAMINAGARGEWIPNWGDVESGSMMLIGSGPKSAAEETGEAMVVQRRIANIYTATGRSPDQIVADAARDPAIRRTILTTDDLPAAYRQLAVKTFIPDLDPALKKAADAQYENADPAFRPPVPVELQSVNDPEVLKAGAMKLANIFDAQLDTQRRGTVSFEETQAAATKELQDLIGTDAVSNIQAGAREPGAPTIDGKVSAYGALAVKGVQDIHDQVGPLWDQYKNAKPEEVKLGDLAPLFGSIMRPYAMIADAAGDAAEAGRALNAVKMASGMRATAETIRTAFQQFGLDGDPVKLLRTLHDMTDPDGLLASVKPGFMRTINLKANDLWRAFLLGPHSWIAKGVGDATKLSMEAIARPIAATIGRLDMTEKAREGNRVFYQDALAFPTGILRAVPSAFKIMYHAASDPESSFRTGFEPRADDMWDTSMPLDYIAKQADLFPSRILGGTTEFFKTLHEEGTRYELAVHDAINDGFQPGTTDYEAAVTKNAEVPSAGNLEKIVHAGQYGTFTSPLEGKFGESVRAFSQHWLGRWILPFTRVPINLQRGMIEHIPLVGMLIKDTYDDMAAGGARMHMAMARQLIGGTAMYMAYHWFSQGTMTAGRLFDTPGQKQAEDNDNLPYYSMKIGDHWYGYGRIPVLGPLMMTMADLVDAHAHADTPLAKQTYIALGAAVVAHAMSSMSYFTALHQMFQMGDEPSVVGYIASQEAGTLVPGVLRDIAEQQDPNRRRVDNVLDNLREGLPYVREQLLPKINQETGQPLPNASNITPFDFQKVSHDKLTNEWVRLGLGITEPPKEENFVRHAGQYGKEQITPDQQNLFGTTEGQIVHDILEPFVNSRGYDTMPEPRKVEVFERAVRDARRIAAKTSLTPEQREAEMEAARAQFGSAMQQQ